MQQLWFYESKYHHSYSMVTAWGLGEDVSTFIPWWSVSDRKNIMTKLLGARFCQLLSLIPVLSNYVGFRSPVSETLVRSSASHAWRHRHKNNDIKISTRETDRRGGCLLTCSLQCEASEWMKMTLILLHWVFLPCG